MVCHSGSLPVEERCRPKSRGRHESGRRDLQKEPAATIRPATCLFQLSSPRFGFLLAQFLGVEASVDKDTVYRRKIVAPGASPLARCLAYEAGDVGLALKELGIAKGVLEQQRAEGLSAFLPAAPEGWSRELTTELTAAMPMLGGGSSIEATYASAQETFRITLMGDNPMVLTMAPFLAQPEMAPAYGGKLHRVGDVHVLEMDGSLSALAGNRYLVQAEGAPVEVMLPLLAEIDFEGLAGYMQ
ncbi:hypothetical protein [Mangrovicoccus ximenensis]|uniref:hypothetical protein n=1 Tax=Mangrovicoccus ximenensis TaxID=1911570 RepID=UPI000D3DB2D0|nr:hypothetical protein [Mangrovicoccus ximenensis]